MNVRTSVLSSLVAAGFGCFTVLPAAGQHPIAEQVADSDERIGVGDILQVAIFESRTGDQPGNFVTLPAQTVDCTGTISVPLAGQIQAAGRTPPEIQRQIEARLAERAIEPRVTVTLLESGRPILGGCRPLIEAACTKRRDQSRAAAHARHPDDGSIPRV